MYSLNRLGSASTGNPVNLSGTHTQKYVYLSFTYMSTVDHVGLLCTFCSGSWLMEQTLFGMLLITLAKGKGENRASHSVALEVLN